MDNLREILGTVAFWLLVIWLSIRTYAWLFKDEKFWKFD